MPRSVPHLPFYGFSSCESYTQWRQILTPIDDQAYFDFKMSRSFNPAIDFPPSELLVYTCKRPKRKPTLHEDMPWCLDGAIVSARLLELLERMQPGMIRSKPVQVQCEACAQHGYSQILTDLELNCFDPERSRWRHEYGTISIQFLTIDPAKVPADAHVFRVTHFFRDAIMVTRAFYEEYTRLKMSGCYFPDWQWKGSFW